jgi:hypothetical protein
MRGTSAVAASRALAMPLRSMVVAQPETANAITVKRPTRNLGLNTQYSPGAHNFRLLPDCCGALKAATTA